MSKFSKLILALALIANLPLLAACGAAPTAAPTVDMTAVFALAARTIEAGVTQTAAAMPTLTPTEKPTRTPRPTATEQPSPTTAPVQDLTSTTPPPNLVLPTQPSQPTQPPQIAASPTPAIGAVKGDAARYLYTVPADYTEIEPNHTFNISWGFQNVGTTTWTTDYKLIWVGGDHLTSVMSIPLDHNVEPGQKCEFILGAFGSEDLRVWRTDWQLVGPNGLAVPGGFVYFIYKAV